MPQSQSNPAVRSKEAPLQAQSNRDTATFTPYFWEAYNEIVQPRRFDWYLMEKWLPELGALGFAIVKVLRGAGYNNRETGIVRSEIRMEIAELARRCGVSEPTIHRQFKNNEALKQFVQRESKFRMVNGHPEQCANLYRVCMDDPIHPDDMEAYDLLRCQKESDRTTRPGRKTLDNQIDSQVKKRASVGNQNDSVGNQNDRAGLTVKMTEQIDRLPSESITKESNTPITGDTPPINPPVGEDADTADVQRTTRKPALLGVDVPLLAEVGQESGLDAVWSSVMEILKGQVEAGEINAPTFHGHLTKLRIISLNETTTAEGVTDSLDVVIGTPSVFTRDWVEKRLSDRLRGVLGAVLGRADGVTLTFNVMSK
jgi:hypothetical protein